MWTPRWELGGGGAPSPESAQVSVGAGRGRGRAGEEEKVEAGAPGRAALEPGLGGQPAFGDDAAVRPPCSPAPSGGGAHAAPWSWVPRWSRRSAPRTATRAQGGRAVWVRIVFGQVRIRAGPGTSRGNRSGVASAFRRPGGLRWKRRAGRRAPTWAGGELLLPELVSPVPLSGLLGTSLPLVWLGDGPAQSLGESSSQTPRSPLLRGHPS